MRLGWFDRLLQRRRPFLPPSTEFPPPPEPIIQAPAPRQDAVERERLLTRQRIKDRYPVDDRTADRISEEIKGKALLYFGRIPPQRQPEVPEPE